MPSPSDPLDDPATRKATADAHVTAQTVRPPPISQVLDVLRSLTDELAVLRSQFRSQKLLVRWLIVSVAFDIALSVGLGAGGIVLKQVADKANHNASVAVQVCNALNASGRQQAKLWNPILKPALADINSLPPDQQKSTRTFAEAVALASRQRDCSKL